MIIKEGRLFVFNLKGSYQKALMYNSDLNKKEDRDNIVNKGNPILLKTNKTTLSFLKLIHRFKAIIMTGSRVCGIQRTEFQITWKSEEPDKSRGSFPLSDPK